MVVLHRNETWTVGPLPANHHVVGCRWVYTIKYHPDGFVDKFKARLVAKGYSQILGPDFHETFSPVAKLNSVCILISLAVHFDSDLFQLDVKNAFLHGDLQELVYMQQPPGFVLEGENGRVYLEEVDIWSLTIP